MSNLPAVRRSRRRPAAARFWEKVAKTDGCWTWQGAGRSMKYGRFWIGGRNELPHRVAWILTYGPIPDGLCICHSCDNPKCVRPSHLFLGTHKQNSEDMVAKGRSASGDRSPAKLHPEALQCGDDHWSRRMPERVKRGSKHNQAKLTEADVRRIREEGKQGQTLAEIASKYGVHLSSIHLILKSKTWKHITVAGGSSE